MKGYTCFKCGYGSLVRSNFKGTSDGKFYCRGLERCRKRSETEPNTYTILRVDEWSDTMRPRLGLFRKSHKAIEDSGET